MFTETIMKFDSRLDKIMDILNKLTHRVEELFNQLEDNKSLVKESNDKLRRCADGFHQTKEACQLLREELSEAARTIIRQTWLD